MVFALSCSKSGESFLASLKEDLRNLEKEVEHSSSLPEQERILKLRNVVTHIKQWEKF
jgi:hypothetical protein